MTVFEEKVWQIIKTIPRGRVITYQEIAKAIKKPKAVRAVGNAVKKNPWSPIVPCHRVVKSDGRIGGYANGSNKKLELLKKEGVKIKNNKIIDFREILYRF